MKFRYKLTIVAVMFSCVFLLKMNAQELSVHMGEVSEMIPKMQLTTAELIRNSASLSNITLQLQKKAAEITKIVGKPPAPALDKEVFPVMAEHIEKLKALEDSAIDLLARSKRDTESKLVNSFIPVMEKLRELGFFLQDTIKSKYFKEKVEVVMTGIERPEVEVAPIEEIVEEPEFEEEEEEEEFEEEEEEVIEEPPPAPTAPLPISPEPEIEEEPLAPEELLEEFPEIPEELPVPTPAPVAKPMIPEISEEFPELPAPTPEAEAEAEAGDVEAELSRILGEEEPEEAADIVDIPEGELI